MELILTPTAMEAMRASHLMVVKDNRLLEARFSLKLWEMRIFERMISLIDYGDKDFRLSRLYIRDLLNFFTCTGHNNYEMIREAVSSLADKKIHVRYQDEDGHQRWAKLSIFPTVTMPDEIAREGEPAYIELAFHRDLKPYLLDLKARFKAYPIANIRALQSIYSIRLFILLKQHEDAPEHTIDLPYLRTLLGLEQNEYPNFNDFKRRVLLRPQRDMLKHCDICFEFTELTEGKRVTAISFIVRKNRNVNHEVMDFELSPKQRLSFILAQNYLLLSPVWNLASQWGVSEKVFLQVIETTPFRQVQISVDFIYQQLNEAKVEIKNIPAYFLSLAKLSKIALDASKSKKPTHVAKIEKDAPKAKPATNKSKLEVNKELISLKRSLFAAEDHLMEAYVWNLEDEPRAEFLEQIGQSPLSRYNSSLPPDDNFRYNRVFRYAVKAQLLLRLPELFMANNQELRQTVQRVQKLYNTL